MPWGIALLSVIVGYFLILVAMVWSACKAKIEGDRLILILIFKNAGASVEAVMWDLFRLKSWDYQGLSFMVIDDKSDDGESESEVSDEGSDEDEEKSGFFSSFAFLLGLILITFFFPVIIPSFTNKL
mgnify:CR=1 FL=1